MKKTRLKKIDNYDAEKLRRMYARARAAQLLGDNKDNSEMMKKIESILTIRNEPLILKTGKL